MEAGSRLHGIAIALVACVLSTTTMYSAFAADHRTRNFIVQAPNPQLAVAVGTAAEKFRADLAKYWTGSELPPWPQPCPIRVVAGPNLAAQGVTTYNPRPVKDFQMEVVGTPERILDSVLPHEVTHTVLATYFGRPLPRWADEGICTTVEHASERRKHDAKLMEFLGTRRGIAMNQLFLMTEYPSDVLPMYAQGYSVCRFMIAQQGPRTFVDFLRDYMQHPSWTSNVRKHYGYESLRELQENWLAWVKSGSGDVTKFAKLQPRGPGLQHGPGQPARSATPVALALHTAQGTAVKDGWEPNDTNLRLASATPNAIKPKHPHAGQPSETPNGIQPIHPASAVAQATEQGWYKRRMLQAQTGTNRAGTDRPGIDQMGTDRPLVAREPIMPPSVKTSGTYSVSQPQGEQQWSRGSVRLQGPVRLQGSVPVRGTHPSDRVFVPQRTYLR